MINLKTLKSFKKEDIIEFIKPIKKQYLQDMQKICNTLTCYDLVKYVVYKHSDPAYGRIVNKLDLPRIVREALDFQQYFPLNLDLVPFAFTKYPVINEETVKEALLQLYKEDYLQSENFIQNICRKQDVQPVKNPFQEILEYQLYLSYDFWIDKIGVTIKKEDLD